MEGMSVLQGEPPGQLTGWLWQWACLPMREEMANSANAGIHRSDFNLHK